MPCRPSRAPKLCRLCFLEAVPPAQFSLCHRTASPAPSRHRGTGPASTRRHAARRRQSAQRPSICFSRCSDARGSRARRRHQHSCRRSSPELPLSLLRAERSGVNSAPDPDASTLSRHCFCSTSSRSSTTDARAAARAHRLVDGGRAPSPCARHGCQRRRRLRARFTETEA